MSRATPCRQWRRGAGALSIVVVLAGACTGEVDAPQDATPSPAGGPSRAVAFDVGVTEDACPEAVNPDNGCIYLGTISVLSGDAHARDGRRISEAQAAFWQRVNRSGGIGGFDVDVGRFTRDGEGDPRVHRRRYLDLRDDVLALAQTFGAETTAAIRDDLQADTMVAVPTTRTSEVLFDDALAESGDTVCVEAMNAVDYLASDVSANSVPSRRGNIDAIATIHLPDDAGRDAEAGARLAAERNGVAYTAVETGRGAGGLDRAVATLVADDPDLVIVATTPRETAEIARRAAARGYDGTMIATSQAWDDALLAGPDADAVASLVVGALPYRGFGHGTVGHAAMRDALGNVEPDDAYTSGWISSYPLHDALRVAAERGDLTRRGVRSAVDSLDAVDYEFMLPVGAGALGADTAAGRAFTRTVFRIPDPTAGRGATSEEDYFAGITAATHDFARPCDDL